jgi:hypothetical protein
MKKKAAKKIPDNDCVGCFGNFDMEDLMCKKFCALHLRCAIERDQSIQLELLEDDVAYAEGIKFVF